MTETKLQLLLSSAHFMAKSHHAGQTYAWDKDYYETHIIPVLTELELTMRPDHYSRKELYFAKIVAILHDILEDTTCTYEDLVERFGTEIADMVLLLTSDKTRPRIIYLNLIKQQTIPRLVKIADATVNLRTSMMTNTPRLIQKYLDTLGTLTS